MDGCAGGDGGVAPALMRLLRESRIPSPSSQGEMSGIDAEQPDPIMVIRAKMRVKVVSR